MTEQTNTCAALLLPDGWECEKCALAWDDADERPDCQTLTYARLRQAALNEAEMIEQSQRALTMGDERRPPINKFRQQGQLKRAMELRALARLVDKAREQDKGKAA
jgi:hypothetical protein